MAVTGFWPVKGQLKSLIDYADNPEKTTDRKYVDNDLYAALRYAANDDKTDRTMFVGGINCSAQYAYEEMIAVQKRFGNHGSIVAYHGIQSFREGEVTPEEAFEIGKETARRMWGDRYQVLVTVHLNTENIHCHFVVNPVSFIDGAKFRNKIGDHKELRKISDAVCRERGKSVLENSQFYSKEKKSYWVHKEGRKTHRDQLKEDVEYCLRYSYSYEGFEKQLHGLGYEIDPVRFSVKAKGWERAVRLESIGLTPERLEEELMKHLDTPGFVWEWNDHLPYRPRVFPLEYMAKQMEFSIEHSENPETILIDMLFLLLIRIIEMVMQMEEVIFLTPDLRHEMKELEEYREDYHFLREERIQTIPELEKRAEDFRQEISSLEHERNKADNVRRRAKTPEEKTKAKEKRRELSAKIKPLRGKLKRAEKILQKSPHLMELLKQEHRLERQAIRNYERSR